MKPSGEVHCEDPVKEYHLFTQQVLRKFIQRARAVLSGEHRDEQSTEPRPHGEDVGMGRKIKRMAWRVWLRG